MTKTITIIGGMGPDAGLFAHELILKHARCLWGTTPEELPYLRTFNAAC